MVFEKLVSSIANRLDGKEVAEPPLMRNELQQGIEYLNTRGKEITDLTSQLSLINSEGFSTKPLDEATSRELDIIKSLKNKFDVSLSSYSRKYQSFMSNYNKYSGMVTSCKQKCNSYYPVGSVAWNYNRQACKGGCEIKGPYATQCEDRYKSMGGNMSCSAIEARGVCSGGSVIDETSANNPAEKDSKYGNTYAEGCCVCGGGSGGPPQATVRGSKVKNCNDMWRPFGYNKPNFTVNACRNAPYASPQGAANLWRDYNSLVASNNDLMNLSKLIYAKIEKLRDIDNSIAKDILSKRSLLKKQLSEFDTTYATLKSVEGQTTATTTGILNDLHLRNQAANLRFYPWALLAISGLAIAIYQIKKA